MGDKQSYDFNLSVGITELLDADSAAKVESQIEKHKQKLEQPVEIKVQLNVQDAKARIKELQANMTSVARAMQKITNKKGTLGKADYDNIAKHHGTLQRDQREIDNLTKQLKEQGVTVRNNTKEYKALQAVLEDIGYVEKKKKTTSPRKNAASEVKKQTTAEKEHIQSIEESTEAAEAQAKASKKTKKTHDDAAAAAKERAKAEQEVSDVGKTQGKILDTVTAKTQKQTDAIKKQEKATRDLAKAQQAVNVKKQSAKTMADFQKLWGKASKNYSAEDFGKRYGHLMESITGDNPTMTIDAAYKELQKKDREYRKQLAAENAKSQAKAVELQAFNTAMSPLMTQISASEKLTQQYAKALEEITAGSLTAAAATERLQEALNGANQETPKAYIAAQQKLAERAKNLKSGSEMNNFGRGRVYSGKEGRLTLATSLANDLSQFDLTNDELNDLVAKTYEQFSKVKDLIVDKETWTKQMRTQLNENALFKQLNTTYERPAIRTLVKDPEFVSYIEQAKDGLISIEDAMGRIDMLARNSGLAQYIKPIDNAIGGVQAETAAIEQQTKAIEKNVKVQQQRLKLTKAEGGYTAIDGQYKITRGAKDDAYKWYVTQRDASGRYSAWDGFDSLDEIRNDEFLIAQQEVVSQLKALNMFEMPSGQISMFDGMTESAEKTTVAVKELNDVTQDATIIPGQIGLDELEKKFDRATKLIEAQRKKYGDAFDGMYQDVFDSLGELSYANAELIIDEIANRIEDRFFSKHSRSNLVYHAGNLSNIEQTLKSFPLGNVPPRKSIGIGGLTGLYTTEDVDGFWGNEWSGAPISTIDISGYKLLNARVNEFAEMIGSFLNDLNATIYGYYEAVDEKDWTLNKYTDVKSIDELYNAHKKLFHKSSLSIEQFTQFINDATAKIAGKAFADIKLPAIDEGIAKSGISSALQDVSEELFQSDSFQTQFLKMLGYEGVDLRGTKYGGTYTGGTVLFDPKKESIVETNAMWSDVMRKHGYEIDESSLEMEKKRRQLALDTAKAYSKQADAVRQVQAEVSGEIASSDESAAKAKLTAIKRQAYNYRRPAKNADALTERTNTLYGRLDEIEAIRTEFPALAKACDAAESAVTETIGSLQKLAQATEGVSVATDHATQQTEEQTAALREQSAAQPKLATKLTASEYQAAFGGDILGQFLAGFNIKGQVTNDIADIAVDAMRGQKMMIEGSQSGDTELLSAGAQLFNESVRKASVEIMNLGTTVDGTDDVLKDFYAYMSGKKIRYNESDKAEFAGKAEWKAVRQRFSNVLTASSKGVPIDTIWEEILGLFPGLFDDSIVNEKDQLMSVLDMLGKARDAKKNNWKNIMPIHGSADEVQGSVISVFTDMGDAMSKAMSIQAKLVAGEEEIAEAASQTTTELKAQNAERQKAESFDGDVDEPDSDDGEVSAQKIIERSLNDAIKQLRNAQNNETTLFSLKDVGTGEGLVDEARSFVDNIAEEANLKLGKFTVKDNIIQAQLYNDELKVVVDQTYRLQQATEKTEAALELIGQSFSQNVKALNANNFDVDGIRARAAASVEKLKSSLHGLEYDTSGLEDAAKNITSQADFTKFNNQLKAAQDQIQAIKNSTVSKNTMNQLANMQRDMQNANIELDTMKLKLQKLGDVEGAEDATKAIERMTTAVEAYNDAQGAEAQQKAYNEYSTARSEFRARLENLNVKKSVKPDDSKVVQDDAQNIKKYYQDILDTINQINNLDTKMNDLAIKDKGTGLYSGIIQNLDTQKAYLLNDLNSLQDELARALSIDPMSGQDALSLLFEDARVQAALTVEEVQNIQKAFMQTENIRFNLGAKLSEQVQPVLEKVTRLMQLVQSGAITDAGIVGNIANVSAIIGQKSQAFQADGSPLAAMDFMKYISDISEYISKLDKAANKEREYFANKKQYANVQEYDIAVQGMGNMSSAASSAKQKLDAFVNTFADGKAVITGFTQSADGISKVNFAMLDEGTQQFRTFSAEMGQFTDKVYTVETSMKNLSTGTTAAEKALGSLSDAMARLNQLQSSGQNVGNSISSVWQLMQNLQAKLADVGDSKDVGSQTMLKNLAAEAQKAVKDVAKLEAQWAKTQQAIAEGQLEDLGPIDKAGDKYAQMYAKIRAAAGEATISNQKFDSTTNTLTYTLTEADGKVVQMTAHMDALTGTVTAQEGKVSHLRTAWQDVGVGIKGIGKEALRYATNLFQVMDIVRYMRTGFNEVLAIDTALTELRKVTDETSATYNNFLQTMSKTGAVVGSTVKDLTTSAADWARLGYDLEQAGKLAENTMVLMNVSEFDNVNDATDTLISAIQAFKSEDMDVGDFSMDIIDVFNQIGNSYAISTSDLADSLTRSSASLVAANNSLEQAVALTTAANTTIQNPETVGTTLKTLSMRIRGVKTE